MLLTRRWIISAYRQWWNGDDSNSPLWLARCEGLFPLSSTNTLIPLPWLEAARKPAIDPGGDIICGCDPSGPGRDKTACVACAGSAILDTAAYTNPDGAIGPVIEFHRRWGRRHRLTRVDVIGIGFHFPGYLIAAGFRTEGVNVAKAARDPNRFANKKAELYWGLRERFQRGEVSGLTAEMLSELSVLTYQIDTAGRVAITGKDDVRSVLGHSPDLSESLMLAIGDSPPEPLENAYRGIPRGQVAAPTNSSWLAQAGYGESYDEALRNYLDDNAHVRGLGGSNRFGAWARTRGF
jgi:phage terminase large subunit